MKKILIMGANGYIGSHLTRYLCDQPIKYEVYASGRKNTNIDNRAHYIQYDIHKEFQNPKEYVQCFGNVDACVYLTWQDGFNHNAISHVHDWYYHFNFIKQMLDSGLKHIAVMGSFREYGTYCGAANEELEVRPDNLYVLAKDTLHKAIELYIKNNNMDICFQWIRPFSVYGDDELNNSIFTKILLWEKEGKETFPCTLGTERYDYIHIDECVKQIEAIISQTDIDGVINCCTGKSTSLREQIEFFLNVNHLKIRPEYGSFERRKYDSDEIYGDRTKLDTILEKVCKN